MSTEKPTDEQVRKAAAGLVEKNPSAILSAEQRREIRHKLWYNTRCQIDDTELIVNPLDSSQSELLAAARRQYAHKVNNRLLTDRDWVRIRGRRPK